MSEETKIFYKRIKELSDRSYVGNQFTFTSFLSMGELSDFFTQLTFPGTHEFSISPCHYTIFGGYEGAERAVIRFGNPEDLMYEQPFPIECLKISPLNPKFSDVLTHRDYLGSLMNLGIERSMLGDIKISGKDCFLFVYDSMSDYIIHELTRIRHTTVLCERTKVSDTLFTQGFEEINLLAKSLRVDGIVSKLAKLSRSKTAEEFFAKKVFINSHLCENESYNLKVNDIISIRGYGKYIFDGSSGNTKKGNLIINIRKYI